MSASPQLASLPSNFQPRRLRFFELALVLTVAFGPALFSGVFVFLNKLPTYNPATVQARLAIGVFQALIALAVFGYVLFRQGRTLESIGVRFRGTDFPISVGLAIGGQVGFYTCYVFIYALYYGATGHGLEHWQGSKAAFGVVVTPALVLFAFIAPLAEELIVRGYMISELIDITKKPSLAVVASVVLQSSYHIYQGVPAAIAHSATFFLFSVYYVKTRRIVPVVFAHLLLDLVAFALLYR